MRGARSAAGFTLVEILIVVALIAILASLAAPYLLSAKTSSNEASAIGSLRSINSAQSTFASSCGGGGYAQTLVALNTGPLGGGPGFVSPDLGTAVTVSKSGFTVGVNEDGSSQVIGSACNGLAAYFRYFAWASPIAFGNSGNRHFGTTAEGTVWENNADVAFTSAADLVPGPTIGPIH